MADHYHYDYADQHHSHNDYAAERHDHDIDYAEKHHRHYDDESTAAGLRQDLGYAEARIGELEDALNAAVGRIARLEQRLNADRKQWAADNAATATAPVLLVLALAGERLGWWRE